MARLGTEAEATTAEAAIIALSIPEIDATYVRCFGSIGALVIVRSSSPLSGPQIALIDAAADPIYVAYQVMA